MHECHQIILLCNLLSLPQGTHPSLHGNAKALSTVTAIIDGTGTIGAAIGPLLTGLINPQKGSGWNTVFLMLVGSELIGALVSRSTLWEPTQMRSAQHHK